MLPPTTIGTPQGGVISPLLANIVLNRLDWQVHEAGYHFARYADDFVVVCQTKRQAQEALTLIQQVLEGELGLQLSPEKTHVTTYGKGYDFLGFSLSSRSRRMREKSVQKFKAKVRELTVRKQSGCRGNHQVEPSYQGNGELLRHRVLDLSLDVPETGLVDPHAASLYEAEAEKLQRQREITRRLFSPQAEAIALEEFCT